MSAYDALRDHLLKAAGDEVRLRVPHIERIIGHPLPPSAYGRHWWLNRRPGEGRSRPWCDAGWHVAGFDRATRTVTFRRGPTTAGPVWGREA